MAKEMRVCGRCAFHRKDDGKGWICANEQSLNCGDYTMYSERCPDFDEREDSKDVTAK